MEPFVHLHVHTEYSLLDGANPIGNLVQAAVDDGHEALAITDHGNLFGALEFYQACRRAGVKPILGCEVYVAARSMERPHDRRENPYTHLTLLARNERGWRNLMQLTTAAHLEGQHFRPRIDMERLARHASGITCLSGCMSGPVNRLLRVEDEEGARAMAGRLQDMFGRDHFYLELMRNGLEVQERLTEGMVRMRGQVDAPLIATNDIHYLRHEDCHVQDAVICLNTNARLSDPDRWRMDSDTLYFRGREEMNRIFGDIPEALRNTLKVAEQVDVELELGRLRLPRFEPEDGSTPDEAFRRLCEEGFARRYPGNPGEARKRLEYEIKVIEEMGFVSYFLIVWDLVRHAREQNIPVGPGRGSAAGSMVAYVLGITRIDPLEYDLLFERFLNPARISMPDIDIDFCKDRREEMIEYCRRRYGDDRVCQIITFGKLKAKNALRDMGRVLEVPLSEVDKVAKKIPDGPGVHLGDVLEQEPDLQKMRRESDEHERWFDLALKVEGLSRNTGVHAAGVIIADQPLKDLIPLARVTGTVTTQWDMKYSEEYGLLKMDFLGLRTLTILEEAARLVGERGGERPDLDALPLDDEATYELLRRADTEGVFQLESGGMRRLLADIRPTSYEDVVAVLALFRPGPLGSGLHQVYARRKHGEEEVRVPHPMLEPILSETYGVLIYQEQIMRVAQKMGGFTLSEADSLRKAMGKKKLDLMNEFEDQFLEGARENGVEAGTAKGIWDMMVEFAKYGFNKSHSTGYAMVTYQAAWMKAHHPAEFYAATFTHEAHDTKKLVPLVEDARRHGIRVLPPCVNHSQTSFAVVEDDAVRFGLAAVKGVGAGAAEAIIRMREEREDGRLPDPDEVFVAGVAEGLNRSTFESLIKGGAFDDFGADRLALLDGLEDRLRHASGRAKDRARGQGLLFGAGASGPATGAGGGDGGAPADAGGTTDAGTGGAAADPERQRLVQQNEKQALGMYLSSHPLDGYRDVLGGVSPWDSRNLHEAGQDAVLAIAGIAEQVEVRPTRRDPTRKMARLQIMDLYGAVTCVVFPRVYERLAERVQEDFIGVFQGRLNLVNEEPELFLESLEPLAERDQLQLRGTLEVRLPAADPPVEELQRILRAHSGDSLVRLLFDDGAGGTRAVRAGKEWSVRLSSRLFDELNALLGPDAARPAMDRTVVREKRRAYARG